MNLDNRTPFVAEHYPLTDETGKPILLLIIKATYQFSHSGTITLAAQQEAVELTDIYRNESGTSSIVYSSDLSFGKQATDIALVGNAYASSHHPYEMAVSLQVGKVNKTVLVYGKRTWKWSTGIATITAPRSFRKKPLIYENAFGGHDQSHDDDAVQELCPGNPVGKGFCARKSKKRLESILVPNIENPDEPINSPADRPVPQGFGYIAPSWHPRVQYAGTYDEQWHQERMPLLPADFNKAFFNAAHPDLVYPGYIQGGEQVVIEGTFADRTDPVTFEVPEFSPQCAILASGYSEPQSPELTIDKVHLDTEKLQCILVASAVLPIETFSSVQKSVCYC